MRSMRIRPATRLHCRGHCRLRQFGQIGAVRDELRMVRPSHFGGIGPPPFVTYMVRPMGGVYQEGNRGMSVTNYTLWGQTLWDLFALV